MNSLGLTFRVARSSDFNEILKLSEGIYDGHDYLPLRYQAWMNMDKLHVMLAYTSEKLVGLVACSVVDEGRTAIRRAGRTLSEFRGQGVYTQLSQAMNEFIQRRYPNVCRERFTTGKSYSSLTKLLQLDILSSYAKEKALHLLPFSTNVQIEACTKEYLYGVVFSRPVAQKLFPNDLLVIEHFPIEPLRSNIDYLQQESDLYFAVEKCSDNGFPRSVSFGVLSPRVKFVHWSVNVYTSDPVLYEAHLLHQFQRAREVIKGDFSFDTFQDKSLTNRGNSVLQERLQLQLDGEMSKTSAKLYETKFYGLSFDILTAFRKENPP